MSTESNKTVVRNILNLIENANVNDVGKYYAANWTNHDPSLPPMKGIEGAKQLIGLWSSLSNRKLTVEDMVAEGDRVAAHFTFSGTHSANFLGIPPTGRSFTVTGTGIFKIVDGKATDNWVNFDALGVFQQLGIDSIPKM